MPVRAVRGAITVENNRADDIIEGTKELLSAVIRENSISSEDLISILFSITEDLDAAFPAAAARQLGLTDVALMCTNEIHVPGSLQKCIRLLVHINSAKKNCEIRHIYLKGACVLRPDLCQ